MILDQIRHHFFVNQPKYNILHRYLLHFLKSGIKKTISCGIAKITACAKRQAREEADEETTLLLEALGKARTAERTSGSACAHPLQMPCNGIQDRGSSTSRRREDAT